MAQQLVAAGEQVVDVPSTLASRARVLDSTKWQKNDANEARSVAIVALHQAGVRRVEAEDHVAAADVGETAHAARQLESQCRPVALLGNLLDQARS